MAEAGDMADQDLTGAKRVAVRAAARRLGDPLAVCGSDELALVHPISVGAATDRRESVNYPLSERSERAISEG
jgi:hypothetical protein